MQLSRQNCGQNKNVKLMRIVHLSRATLMFCQFLVPVIEEQKRRGHYVCVCGSDDSDVDTLRDFGIDVFTHNLRRGLNPFNILKAIFYIKKILVEQKIDAVVCHTPLGAGVGRIAAKLARIPSIIYFAHGLPCAPGQNRLTWLCWFIIEKLLGLATDAILVMNRYDENLCKKHRIVSPEMVFRIPGMGVALSRFENVFDKVEQQSVKEELGIPQSGRLVFCVAYVIPEKGIFVLADAARRICSEREDVFFLLAGTGPCQKKLQTIVDDYGLKDNFKLLGWRDDIHRLMGMVDVFTLPTYYFEGLPVSILEAMACGKPVVATKHRGCEDVVVDGETGFLVPVRNADLLAEKIELLIDDKPLCDKMGLAGRLRIEQTYEMTDCTNKIVNVIDKVATKCLK